MNGYHNSRARWWMPLGLLLAGCGSEDDPAVIPDTTTSSVDLSAPNPFAAVSTTSAPPTTTTTTTAPPTTTTTNRPSTTAATRAPTTTVVTAAPLPVAPSSSYANCSEARAAGAAPLVRGEPGYSSKLDRDGDGVACE